MSAKPLLFYTFNGIIIGASGYQLASSWGNEGEPFFGGWGLAIVALLICLLILSLSSLRVIRTMISDEVWSLRLDIRDMERNGANAFHQNSVQSQTRNDTEC